MKLTELSESSANELKRVVKESECERKVMSEKHERELSQLNRQLEEEREQVIGHQWSRLWGSDSVSAEQGVVGAARGPTVGSSEECH